MPPLRRTSHHFERLNPRVSTIPFPLSSPPQALHCRLGLLTSILPLVSHLTAQILQVPSGILSANSCLLPVTAVRGQRRQLLVSGVQHHRENMGHLPTSAPYILTRRLSNSADASLSGINELLRLECASRRNSRSVLPVPSIARIKFLTKD